MHKFIGYFILTVFYPSCGRIKNKAKSTGKKLVDTAISKVFSEQENDSFSIRSIVKDFQHDQRITEIKGIQTDIYFIYMEYCVYRGKMNRVLNGVNKIVPKKVNDYTSDDKCHLVSAQTFYHDIVPEEKNGQTAFFWNFEKLKAVEIYSCTKAPLRHYIIFDKNSDTVYHRIEEIRD